MKTKNQLKYSTQEEILAQFKEEKNYPISIYFMKKKPREIIYILQESCALAALTCLLLVGFIFLV